MEVEEAKKKVKETGLRLLQEGLVARTWGNISCRIDRYRFAISPSGLFYEDIRDEHIPVVCLADLSWEGMFKPSSEKELHARLYRNHPGVGAIIHTHQPAASSAAAARIGLDVSTPCVPYALPTTRLLAKKTASLLKGQAGWTRGSLLLSNHGAVCAAPSLEEALEEALNLEIKAREVIEKAYASLRRKDLPRTVDARLFRAYGESLLYGEEGEQKEIFQRGKEMNPVAVDEIFAEYPDIATVIHSRLPYTRAYSRTGLVLKPFLDDMAQIIGINVRVAIPGKGRVRKKLGTRRALLLMGEGAYCLGKDDEEARAVMAVLEKSARCVIESELLGGGHRISLPERFLMRQLYMRRYAPLSSSAQPQ